MQHIRYYDSFGQNVKLLFWKKMKVYGELGRFTKKSLANSSWPKQNVIEEDPAISKGHRLELRINTSLMIVVKKKHFTNSWKSGN